MNEINATIRMASDVVNAHPGNPGVLKPKIESWCAVNPLMMFAVEGPVVEGCGKGTRLTKKNALSTRTIPTLVRVWIADDMEEKGRFQVALFDTDRRASSTNYQCAESDDYDS